ncbi:MAG: glycoside hydrolase family 5 protein [Polymorphobacter sp.]
MRKQMVLAALLIAGSAMSAEAASLTGINIAGGEFGGLIAVYGKDYIYPDKAQMQHFRDVGMNIIRVPVRWERLQPALNAPLDPTEMARVDTVIDNAADLGLKVVIDVHNYARYARKPLGSPAVPAAALRDLWLRLATRYRANDAVVFGLMNEPVRISSTAWAAAAQDAVSGIRSAGARQLILVPGAYWSGAHSWTRKAATPSNGDALRGLRDPASNMVFDFHQYFDANSSGTTDACVTPEIAVKRLAVATTWLRATGNRGFLSEFGVGRTPECGPVLKAALDHMAGNPEWLGWTIWASSAWFGTYPFNLHPSQSPPQLAVLKPYLVNRPAR